MLDCLYQSAVVFFIPYLVWQLGLAASHNGKGIDSLANFGTTVVVAAIFAANTYVGMNTDCTGMDSMNLRILNCNVSGTDQRHDIETS
jgi:hypothetical protein